MILDASWSADARRLDAERLAIETSSELDELPVRGRARKLPTRGHRRALHEGTDASDASAAIASELRELVCAVAGGAWSLDTDDVAGVAGGGRARAQLHSNR